MIPKEIYEKYNVDEPSEYYSEYDFYYTFLCQTDHIPNKIIESLVEDLANAKTANFIELFIKFIVSVKTEYKEILQYRKIAREEINKSNS